MKNFQRLDRVRYQNHLVYIHHISENGFVPTAWLYNLPEDEKRTICLQEPVNISELTKVSRNIDFQEFLTGNIGIDHLLEIDKQELIQLCMNNNIVIKHAALSSYYQNLWFISDNILKTVQTIDEAKQCTKIYNNILDFFLYHEIL